MDVPELPTPQYPVLSPYTEEKTNEVIENDEVIGEFEEENDDFHVPHDKAAKKEPSPLTKA